MINVTREANIPTSLQKPEIQTYIDACADYKADPDNKEKPKAPTSYRNSDVLQAFDRCFFAKCYLTEESFVNSWVMDIEHFESKAEHPELRYEWTNLFPCDHRANMCKPRNTPEGGYLNPCLPEDDVENDILYALSASGERPFFEARDTTNIKAKNTAELLDRIHNGHDNNTNQASANLRNAIRKKTRLILNKIIAWQQSKNGTQEKFQAKIELKALLSRKASYTMLCRSIPAVRQFLPPDFLD